MIIAIAKKRIYYLRLINNIVTKRQQSLFTVSVVIIVTFFDGPVVGGRIIRVHLQTRYGSWYQYVSKKTEKINKKNRN